MSALRWLAARRWGQIVCFTSGGYLLVMSLMDADADPEKRGIIVGGIFLAAGLALKAIDAVRNRPK